MARAKGEEKHMLMATLLFDEFRYTQGNIAKLMEVSQSTISSWIKYGRMIIDNKEMRREVNKLRDSLEQLEYTLPKELDSNIIDIL